MPHTAVLDPLQPPPNCSSPSHRMSVSFGMSLGYCCLHSDRAVWGCYASQGRLGTKRGIKDPKLGSLLYINTISFYFFATTAVLENYILISTVLVKLESAASSWSRPL